MKRLHLTDEQEWLVFHGLGSQIDQLENIAAIDFRYAMEGTFKWSFASMREKLDEMRECHALRVKLRPSLFQAKATQVRRS